MFDDALGRSPVSWAGMTYDDIGATATESGSVLVVPVGSIEQHGHHLPVSTDTLLADAVATSTSERVAEELPVVVTPPLYPGFSPHHLPFGGTLSLSFEHMLRAVVDTVETGLENGFDAVVLVNGHGGNIPLIGAVTSVVGVNYPDRLVSGLSYFELAAHVIDDIRDSETGGMAHAGEFETSLMLHLRPDLVNEDAMEGTYMDDSLDETLDDMFDGGALGVYRPFTAYSDSGAIGDPELASAEKGAELFEELTARLAAVLLDIHEETT